MLAQMITLLCAAKEARLHHWEEPVKRADLQALLHTTYQLKALPPSTGMRESVISYNARAGGLTSLPEASPRDKQALRCASGKHSKLGKGKGEGELPPVRMRTGLKVVPAGIHDLRKLSQDGSYIGELPEELRFVQLIRVVARSRCWSSAPAGRTILSSLRAWPVLREARTHQRNRATAAQLE